MEGKILLSIIIPVYNVEQYLEKCLDSILCCNLKDCELLLSIGKSSDQSEVLCREYEKKFSFIQFFNQSGKGLSNARNCALDIANGRYVLFLDSDDYVDSKYLDIVISSLRSGCFDSDLIVTDYRRLEWSTGRMEEIYQIGNHTPVKRSMSYLPQMLHRRQCFWNVWRYLYRLEFLRENQIRFLENRLSEDVDFTVSVFLAKPTVIFSHSPYYVYVVGRGNSLMDVPNWNRLQDTVYVLKRNVNRLKNSDFTYAPQLAAQFQFEYLLNLALVVEIDETSRKDAFGLYEDWPKVLAGSTDPLVRLVSGVMRFTGVQVMSWGLHFVKRLRRWKRYCLQKRRIKR